MVENSINYNAKDGVRVRGKVIGYRKKKKTKKKKEWELQELQQAHNKRLK